MPTSATTTITVLQFYNWNGGPAGKGAMITGQLRIEEVTLILNPDKLQELLDKLKGSSL